jgi:hypothetical protein
MPLDTKWGFKKSPDKSPESPMMEMKEHSNQSRPMDKEKDTKNIDMEMKEGEGGVSPSDAGLRPIDATCSDCRYLSEDETKCSKVSLPSNFSAYQMVCSKFFEPKDSPNVPSSDTSSQAPAPPSPPTA